MNEGMNLQGISYNNSSVNNEQIIDALPQIGRAHV